MKPSGVHRPSFAKNAKVGRLPDKIHPSGPLTSSIRGPKGLRISFFLTAIAKRATEHLRSIETKLAM
jgi:hypothetical protein